MTSSILVAITIYTTMHFSFPRLHNTLHSLIIADLLAQVIAPDLLGDLNL